MTSICDAGRPVVVPDPTRTRWSAVVALGLAMLVVTSEMTIAAVTLPGIGADLGVGPAATAWVLLGYALPLGAIAIPLGRWVDGADVRTVFTAATVGVGLTSVAAALAPGFGTLVGARVLQGLAGALIVAVYMPLVVAAVRPAQRGRAIGAIVTIMTLGAMAGVPIGGLVAGAFGWREVMVLKVPLLLVVLVLGMSAVPRTRVSTRLPRPSGALLREAVLLGGAVSALLLAVGAVTRRPGIAVLVAAGGAVLALCWARGPAAAQVLKLAGGRALAPVLGSLAATTFSSGLVVFALPYFMADVLGEGPERTALAMLFFVGCAGPAAALAGVLADRHGPVPVAAVGSALTVTGLLTMLTLGPTATMFDLGWRLGVLGAGVGLFNAPVNAALLAAAPAGMAGVVGGIGMTVRTIAMTGGPAVAATCWATTGGGVTGFRAAVTSLAAVGVLGVLALAPAAVHPHGHTVREGSS